MSTLTAARSIVGEAGIILAGVEEVGPLTTTVDTRTIPAKVQGGDLVVVANPPARTFDTWNDETWEWSVWLIAGPANDLERAWARLDAAVDALAVPLEVTRAAPDAFTDQQRATYPAYVLTITSHRHTA